MASLVPPELVPSDLCGDYTGGLTYDHLADYLESETQVLEELWRVQGFPTPPTSPERVYSPTEEEDSESDCSQDLPLLNELVLLTYGEDVLTRNPLLATVTASSDLQDKLIQDCMWSGHLCANRERADSSNVATPTTLAISATTCHVLAPVATLESGVYTPAASPPPPPPVIHEGESGGEGEMSEACISPAAVFPSLVTPATTTSVVTHGNRGSPQSARVAMVTRRPHPPSGSERLEKGVGVGRRRFEQCERRMATMAMAAGGNRRTQPQAESSTSDEEIDVVTVPSLERASKLSRKRSLPLSPPSSPNSPCSPPKRKKYHAKRLGSAGSSGDGMESDDEARRASHNVLERKRRNDLKSSFQKLREEIPELEDNQRAPKVTILRKAMDFIRQMKDQEMTAERQLQAERRRKAKLIERLNKLRSLDRK